MNTNPHILSVEKGSNIIRAIFCRSYEQAEAIALDIAGLRTDLHEEAKTQLDRAGHIPIADGGNIHICAAEIAQMPFTPVICDDIPECGGGIWACYQRTSLGVLPPGRVDLTPFRLLIVDERDKVLRYAENDYAQHPDREYAIKWSKVGFDLSYRPLMRS